MDELSKVPIRPRLHGLQSVGNHPASSASAFGSSRVIEARSNFGQFGLMLTGTTSADVDWAELRQYLHSRIFLREEHHARIQVFDVRIEPTAVGSAIGYLQFFRICMGARRDCA